MMNNDQLYEINLEDYSFPRYASTVKSYYGTMDDIINLMVHLADSNWTRTRYQETIDAAEYYDLDNESTHTVAGQVFPILTPVQELCRFETRLADQSWNYKAYSGAVYPCRASEVDVCQTLISTESGYERCIRVSFTGLNTFFQGAGWCMLNNVIKGFPGVVTWDGKHQNLNLFVSQKHYVPDELTAATTDTVDVNAIDLAAVMADILATG